jgi:hypothetical protein
LDVDVTIDAGWQFLRQTSVRTSDGVDVTYAHEIVSLTLDEVAGAGVIGEAWPPGLVMPVSRSDGRGSTALSSLFR